ncbi:hypothetical protein HHK36_021206 [Tetracentron sinense]|uniref:Uncharacterized protein n=1 Tax=Tetracentron sinense TaxID=13715 RepID=A0A834YSP6_TETSI|nr:hypothetical protein HHK36_021206 [Tetracentron sinense]
MVMICILHRICMKDIGERLLRNRRYASAYIQTGRESLRKYLAEEEKRREIVTMDAYMMCLVESQNEALIVEVLEILMRKVLAMEAMEELMRTLVLVRNDVFIEDGVVVSVDPLASNDTILFYTIL